jgi:hypothetical protein
MKTRLWNWDVGFDAAKKAWGGSGNPWAEYLVNLRAAKEVEASTLSRNELESEFVELSIIMAQLLSEANKVHDSWTYLGREYDDFAERMFRRNKGVSKGGDKAHEGTAKIKKEAHKIWLEWQAGKHPEIGTSQAAFGRHIEGIYKGAKTTISARTVETAWCPEWRKLQSAS